MNEILMLLQIGGGADRAPQGGALGCLDRFEADPERYRNREGERR